MRRICVTCCFNLFKLALVATAIAVGTASVVEKINDKRHAGGINNKPTGLVSEQMVVAAAMQMEKQAKSGIMRTKEQYIKNNICHVFENVPSSVFSSGRRFSWGHHSHHSLSVKGEQEKMKIQVYLDEQRALNAPHLLQSKMYV